MNQFSHEENQTNMMIHDVIHAKIDYLNGLREEDIDLESLPEEVNCKSLQDELKFVEALWKKTDKEAPETPSPQMRANFYQMLSHAQTVQATVEERKESTESPRVNNSTVVSVLGKWFGAFQPAIQVMLVIAVFGAGWLFNASLSPKAEINQGLLATQQTNSALEEKMDALNVMVAMSMLKNESASQRLAGLDYATRVGLTGMQLNRELFRMIETDESSSVRISAIETLANQSATNSVKQRLIDSLAKQSNVIVQIAMLSTIESLGELSGEELKQVLSIENLDEEIVESIRKKYFGEGNDRRHKKANKQV